MKANKRQDAQHLKAGYTLLKEALDELLQIREMDNITAHAVRVMGAIEDTLYEYVGGA